MNSTLTERPAGGGGGGGGHMRVIVAEFIANTASVDLFSIGYRDNSSWPKTLRKEAHIEYLNRLVVCRGSNTAIVRNRIQHSNKVYENHIRRAKQGHSVTTTEPKTFCLG